MIDHARLNARGNSTSCIRFASHQKPSVELKAQGVSGDAALLLFAPIDADAQPALYRSMDNRSYPEGQIMELARGLKVRGLTGDQALHVLESKHRLGDSVLYLNSALGRLEAYGETAQALNHLGATAQAATEVLSARSNTSHMTGLMQAVAVGSPHAFFTIARALLTAGLTPEHVHN